MKQWCFWAGCHAKIVIGAVSCGHPNFQQCCCWCFLARPCQSCGDDLILKWEFCRAFPESGISLVVPDTVFFFTPELLHVLRNNIQSPPCWLDAGEVPPHTEADVPHAHCLLCNLPSSCRAAHKCERLPEANTGVQPSCRKGLHNHVRKANSCPRRQGKCWGRLGGKQGN